MTRLTCILVLFAATALADIAPLADETLRLTALRAIFPGMQISLLEGKRIDDSWPEQPKHSELDSPDAFAKETVYRVTGAAGNEAEKQAASQLITGKPSSTRQVRFQIFSWPNSTGLLAVLQYKFEDAVPPMACPTLGLLIQLANVNGAWQIRDRYLLETMHHFSLKTVRMLNLAGDADQLLVESDFGGAETWGTNFLIFNLGAKLERVFETTSQIAAGTSDRFTQEFDAPETIDRDAKEFCFTKTTTFEDGTLYKPPRISKVCYKPGEDPDTDAEERNKLLAPFHSPVP
ncbi:MAG TPA: hypothetical protein VK752_16490 [Bryobacteraceae bacterium]|nr:hypothetical protein [Bryobacteraceae bacterium]